MQKRLEIDFIPKNEQHSDYDWANISLDGDRVGKARCKIDNDRLIIYSINVFPEFEGRGIGKEFVERAKERWGTIVADRVRVTAIGFWEKVGFKKQNDSEWLYRKE